MTETEQQAAEIEHLANMAGDDGAKSGEWEPGSGETMQQQLENMPSEELAKSLLTITFNLLSKIRGPHWEVHPAMIEEAAREYGVMMDKHKDKIRLPPWIGTAFVTASLFGPPVMVEIQLSKQRKQAERDENERDQDKKETGAGVDDGD